MASKKHEAREANKSSHGMVFHSFHIINVWSDNEFFSRYLWLFIIPVLKFIFQYQLIGFWVSMTIQRYSKYQPIIPTF